MAQQINLYNPALRQRRELLTLDHVGVAALALVLVLVTVGAVLRWRTGLLGDELRRVEAGIATTTQRLGELTAQATKGVGQQDLEVLRQQLAERREVLAALRSGVGADPAAAGFADYLRGLARQSVPGLWLTGFAVARGGEGMEIRGRMLDAASLPDYVRRLNAEPGFHGRQFLSLSVEGPAATAPAVPATAAAGAPAAPLANSFVLTGIAVPGGGLAADKGGGR